MANKQQKNQPQKKIMPVSNTPTQVNDVREEKLFNGKDWSILFGLLLICGAIFFQTTKYDFVNWDDDRNITENKLVRDLNKDNYDKNVSQIFKQKVIGNYNPLPIWSFAFENKLYSKSKNGFYDGIKQPGKYHRTNVIFHLCCVIFAFVISRQLGLKTWGAAIAAALFAWHPMRVESVAWVTERKDVMFGFFYLAAISIYLSYKSKTAIWKLVLMYVLFALSLFSKIQAVSLPLTLIVIDYFKDEHFKIGRSILSKLPLFLMSLGFGIYGIQALDAEGSLDTSSNTWPQWQRFFLGSYSFLIYLIKSIVPYQMSPMYPYDSKMPVYFYPSMIMLPITLYAIYISYKRGWKALNFSLLFFIVNIVFLLQILGAGQGFIADRFTYIAYFGIFFGAGFLVDKYTQIPSTKNIGLGISIFGLLIFAVMSFNQVKIWQNTVTLWSHVLKYYNKVTLPYGNRANYYRDKKMFKEALADYTAAIQLKSEPQTHNSRARLYFDTAGNDLEMLKKALTDYNKAIELSPKDGEFRINRGATYARLGDLEKGIKDINEGLVLKPDHATGYLNRFVMNLTLSEKYPLGDQKTTLIKNALADIRKYREFSPYEANTYYESGRLQRILGDLAGAKKDVDKAIAMDGVKGLYYYERAIIHLQNKNKADAKNDIAKARQYNFTAIEPQIEQQINN